MEMIDFIHYLKESNLILTEEQLRDKGLERQFTYQIRLFNERLPGENYSQPSIYWMVKASSLLEMDFSNKEGIYKKYIISDNMRDPIRALTNKIKNNKED